jgi:predicted DNA-binding ribbon-helix-helix protein
MSKCSPTKGEGGLNPSAFNATPTSDLLRSADLEIVQPSWATFSLEAAYWEGLHDICLSKGVTPTDFIANVHYTHPGVELAIAVRRAITRHFRNIAIGEEGKSINT